MNFRIVAIFIMLLTLVGCTKMSEQAVKNPTPKEVITTYFKAYNDKNLELIQSTQSESRRGTNTYYGFDNLKYIKLLSIDENKATIRKEDYMKSGRGSILKPVDVKVFWVEWEQEVFNPKEYPNPDRANGKQGWNFILIKMSKDGQWLIDDQGF